MITWIKIAARNIFKNSRRSLFTILAITFGFAAVNVFGGFTSYIFTSLEDSYIYAQANGHLSVFKKGYSEKGRLDPGNYLIKDEEQKVIREVLQDVDDVEVVTSFLYFTGLLSNGDTSTIFMARGLVPSEIRAIQERAGGMIGKLLLYKGKRMSDDVTHGIGVSFGLANLLGLDYDSDVIAMAPTIEGHINALDATVVQKFWSPEATLSDKLVLAPLGFAQSLYDTTSVDQVLILMNRDANIYKTRAALQEELDRRGLAMEVYTWDEMAAFYTKVKDMFEIIFLFIFVIVLVIVIMIVINTISMSVIERTKEIGTLRALGVKQKGIVLLFAIESFLLGMVGSALGLGLTIFCWAIVKITEPEWTPPQLTGPIPLEVHLVPDQMVVSLFFLLLLSFVSAVIPVRNAARQGIVDALGHV